MPEQGSDHKTPEAHTFARCCTEDFEERQMECLSEMQKGIRAELEHPSATSSSFRTLLARSSGEQKQKEQRQVPFGKRRDKHCPLAGSFDGPQEAKKREKNGEKECGRESIEETQKEQKRHEA